ncbi:glycosyltransferase family 2 protein [Larkinella soli]|uniref:glycosyltransferase family 2 protein n=1 Tax=Larkinella soli TaxID=1770527 RepID=UPI000FFB173B|nr:glycosyltransferase family 2 protein [Larkinella soli]
MINSPRSVLAIVPCYNEESTIAQVVSELYGLRRSHRLPIDVLVVNDCSTDRSLSVIRRLGCDYLDLSVNLGIGGAMQCGYRFAFRRGYSIVVQVDGDGQHPASELPKLLQPLLAGEADVVIGSRFLGQTGFRSTYARRLGIRFFRFLNRLLVGQTVHDSTSGFRAFNRQTLEIVSRYYPDEYPEPEAIVQFGMHGLRMKEVAVEMRERQGGTSSISSLNSIYYMTKVTLSSLFVFLRLKPD